ncbi:MAG: VOC family protein [Chloroflexota bacterium]|nr:VOC family protein [Chloroflexota bacterium]
MYKINHIHLKSNDPQTDANWFVKAFNFKITSDEVRAVGDRFISCESEDGLRVNISGERTNEKLGPSDADPHYGLEHFGFDSSDINADISRLEGMGAVLAEGPIDMPNGMQIAFVKTPGNVRLELIQWPD